MIKIFLGGIGGRVKAAVCSRAYQAGDVVRVPGGKWTEWTHPIGGTGAWAIYVGKTSNTFKVRPLDRKLQAGPTIEVNSIEHLEDVETKMALAAYRQKNNF